MKVSVIVPVYNAKDYLDECVKSIVNQTMSNDDYEVLLVDDCSTDNSVEIAQKYTNIKNIRLIKHNNNKGVSRTLNDGLNSANGKYVFIMACDDTIESKLLETTVEALEKHNLEAVYFGAVIMYDPKNKGAIHHALKDGTKTISDKIESNVIMTGQEAFGKESWLGPEFMFVFKKQFLIDNKLYFNENVKTEDSEFLPRFCMKCKRMMKINDYFYNYRIRLGSVSNSKRDLSIADSFEKCIDSLSQLKKEYSCLNKNEDIQKRFKAYYFYEFKELLISISQAYSDQEKNKKLSQKFYEYIMKYCDIFEGKLTSDEYLLLYDIIEEFKKKDFDLLGTDNYEYTGKNKDMHLEEMINQKIVSDDCIKLSNLLRKYDKESFSMNLVKNILTDVESVIYNYKVMLLKKIGFDDKNKKIGIYGLGGHTEAMIQFYEDNIEKVNADLYFIDSYAPTNSKRFLGRTVVNVNDINEFNLDCIVVSSCSYEKDMIKKIDEVDKKNIIIHRFYEFNKILLFKNNIA